MNLSPETIFGSIWWTYHSHLLRIYQTYRPMSSSIQRQFSAWFQTLEAVNRREWFELSVTHDEILLSKNIIRTKKIRLVRINMFQNTEKATWPTRKERIALIKKSIFWVWCLEFKSDLTLSHLLTILPSELTSILSSHFWCLICWHSCNGDFMEQIIWLVIVCLSQTYNMV